MLEISSAFGLILIAIGLLIWGTAIRMAKSESISEGVIVIGGIIGIVGVALVILTGQFSHIPETNIEATVAFVIISSLSLGVYVFLVHRKSKNEKEHPIQVEVKYPEPITLDLRPLPHYKGYSLPLKVEVQDLGDGRKQASATNVGASTPEYGLLEASQKLEVAQGPIDQPMPELIAKFGVIRVRCTSGDAIDCKAQAKVRLIQIYGQIQPTNFVDWGCLNWYSPAIKRDIQAKFDEIYPAKHLGLNKYLKNLTVDFHQGDEKDLLIFYMIKDLPNVYLCTEVESANAGSIFSAGHTLKFEIEIGMSAQRYPRNTWSYIVTINDFDDFKIEPK